MFMFTLCNHRANISLNIRVFQGWEKNVFLWNENWREHINRQSATQANWKVTLTSYAGHFTQMTNEASLPTPQRQQSELCSMLREAQREKEQQSNPFFFSQDPEQCSRAGGGGRGRGAALLTARDPAVFPSKCAFLSTSLVPAGDAQRRLAGTWHYRDPTVSARNRGPACG